MTKKSDQPKIEIAVKRLLGSVWTIEFIRRGKNECEIVRYSRDNEEGYEREYELPTGLVVETDDRTVTHIRIGSGGWYEFKQKEKLKVINPKHVFDYGA